MYTYDSYEFNAQIKREREIQSAIGTLTAKSWVFNDYGSASVRTYSIEKIFDSYRDYRTSQQWN